MIMIKGRLENDFTLILSVFKKASSNGSDDDLHVETKGTKVLSSLEKLITDFKKIFLKNSI